MTFNPRTALKALAIGMLCLPGLAHAQNAQPAQKHVPLQKTIGEARTETFPSLIVLNSQGATLQGNRLTLTGVAPSSIVFADRPVRAAGHAPTAEVVQEWTPSGETKDSFAKDPPNATISVFSKDGKMVKDAVIVMRSPKLEGTTLTFEVDVLEGDIAGADGPASVFIDIIGMPFTPLSYAGVARRTAYRAAWYRGAAVGAAAAAAAPYYYGPHYGYGRCGYYPYPPCY